jgi:hypothetical protein
MELLKEIIVKVSDCYATGGAIQINTITSESHINLVGYLRTTISNIYSLGSFNGQSVIGEL